MAGSMAAARASFSSRASTGAGVLAGAGAGTGSAARIPGVKVAGKTGTAETNNATANSTFVGFAPYDTPTVAISVVIEQNAKGEESAAGVAGQVLRAALAAQGL